MAKAATVDVDTAPPYDTSLERLNIGSGEDYRKYWVNLDYNDRYDPDVVHDLREGWPFPDNAFSLVSARHVFEHLPDLDYQFREAARVIRPDGHLEVTVPIGINAITDMTHVQRWTADSGLQFAHNWQEWCSVGDYQFDPPPYFNLVDREIELTGHGPLWFMGPLGNWLLEHKPPGVWTSGWLGTSGEVTFVYERRTL